MTKYSQVYTFLKFHSDSIRRAMLSFIESNFLREAHAVLTVYLSTLIGGYSMGFSAVAIPDIKNERMSENQNLVPSIQASSEELSWFGEI